MSENERDEYLAFLRNERDAAIRERDQALARERVLTRVVGLLLHAAGAQRGVLVAAANEAAGDAYISGDTYDAADKAYTASMATVNGLLDGITPRAIEIAE